MEPTDERLIESTRQGDDGAFAELVRRHKGRIFAIAARFARHDQELDDVCQEVFIKAYQNLGQYRADAPFAHWLARIATRACYDLLRRTRREREGRYLPVEEVPLAAAEHGDAVAAREVLARALARLAPQERLVITLLELEERSVREIAGLTGWSEGNVKVRAHRARQKLKEILRDER